MLAESHVIPKRKMTHIFCKLEKVQEKKEPLPIDKKSTVTPVGDEYFESKVVGVGVADMHHATIKLDAAQVGGEKLVFPNEVNKVEDEESPIGDIDEEKPALHPEGNDDEK